MALDEEPMLDFESHGVEQVDVGLVMAHAFLHCAEAVIKAASRSLSDPSR